MLGDDKYELQIVPSTDQIHGPIDGIQQALKANDNTTTALVTLSHTVFKSGYTYNMKQVTEMVHNDASDALVLWDLSHSVGSGVSINLNESNVDLAVGCCYKYLNGGPGASAFLYVRKDLQHKLVNPITGWFSHSNMFNFDLQYTPKANDITKFLVGTPPILSIAAIENGIDIILEATIEKIRLKSIQQTEYFIMLYDTILKPLGGFTLNTPRNSTIRGSHVSIGHATEGWRIDQALIKDMNVIPDFRTPDNIRFGFTPLYTSFVDIYTAVKRLEYVITNKLYEKYTNEKDGVVT